MRRPYDPDVLVGVFCLACLAVALVLAVLGYPNGVFQ